MAVDERSRRELYEALEATLGSEQADTMMSLLPPVGWADVATKRDIEHLQDSLLAGMRKEMTRLVVTMTAATLGAIAVLVVGLVVPLVELT